MTKVTKKEYKKITEKDVLDFFIYQSAISSGDYKIYSCPLVANILRTSKYQIRKYVKILVEKGLLKRDSFLLDPYYWDSPLPYNGFALTKKGYELPEFKEASEKEEQRWSEILENGENI